MMPQIEAVDTPWYENNKFERETSQCRLLMQSLYVPALKQEHVFSGLFQDP